MDAPHDIARFELPAAREDELLAALWSLGTAGAWSHSEAGELLRIDAFFERSALPADDELRRAAAASGARLLGVEPAPRRDWLAEWRVGARPIEVGERFVVDPREPDPVETGSDEPVRAAGGRVLLRLPARTAFGLGSHESTRLAVELLETTPVAGARVLDVGTGSGILALAALRLGARSVVACDVDPAAALLLPAARRLNAAAFGAWAGTVAALASGARFDLELVNVVPSEIEADLPALAHALAPNGRAIFSGILEVQAGDALERLRRHGLLERERRSAGEWVAFVVERAA